MKGIIDSCIPPGMVVEALGCKSNVRIGLLKQAVVVSASATLTMEEEEVKNLMRDYTELEVLAESKLQRTEMMELSLSKEKTVKAQFQRDLKSAHEELKRLWGQPQSKNERCLKATSIVEEFKRKYEDAQSKVKELEVELTKTKAKLTIAMEAKNKVEHERESLQGKLQKKNSKLESANTQVLKQGLELDAFKKKVTALKTTNAEHQRVNSHIYS